MRLNTILKSTAPILTRIPLTSVQALTLPGYPQNRVLYANDPDWLKSGVGVKDDRNGQDFGMLGTSLYLRGGFSYGAQNEEDNRLYWGTNLTKFYGSASEVTDEQLWKLTGNDMSVQAGVPDKRYQIIPWRDEATKANGVMTAVMGDVTNAPDGSQDFGRYYSFTVGENFYTVGYSSANRMYMLVGSNGSGWTANLDFSVLKEADYYLRLWVKTPHAATFTITFLDGEYRAKGYATVTTANNTSDWQTIDIPASNLNLAEDIGLTKIIGIKISPAGSADQFLKTGETFTYGAIDLFKTRAFNLSGSVVPKKICYYATKADGTDWKDDGELLNTYEDSLVFYRSLSTIP